MVYGSLLPGDNPIERLGHGGNDRLFDILHEDVPASSVAGARARIALSAGGTGHPDP